jgi:hypothetical protein
MVHCFPSIILLATHQSHGLISNPHDVTLLESSFQNRRAAFRVPHGAFRSSTCRTFLISLEHLFLQIPLCSPLLFLGRFNPFFFVSNEGVSIGSFASRSGVDDGRKGSAVVH